MRPRRVFAPGNRHRFLHMAVDAVLVAAAFYLAFRLRFLDRADGIPPRFSDLFASSVGPVVAGKLIVFALFGLYEKWWRYTGARDLAAILKAVAVTSALVVGGLIIATPFAETLPRSVAVMDLLLTTLFVGLVRLVVRLTFERPKGGERLPKAREILVVGAGSGGQSVVRELQRNPAIGETAIGFLDDDPRKRGMRLLGLKVLGTTDETAKVLEETRPDAVVIAIPSAPGALRAKVVAACRAQEVPVRTLPTVFELLRGGIELTRQLRQVQVEDVLGREPVRMELHKVGSYLAGRVVLVTGAGGSIGSELARQVAAAEPARLVLLDQSEHSLFGIEQELLTSRHFSRVDAVLADCREADRIAELMQQIRPSVVFHAAAYKHVPMMEANPLEAVRNNALATRIVVDSAAAAGCSRLVLISTDKAVSPENVMGASKALAEWLVEAAVDRHPAMRSSAVRFGNVLGSSGSVVPIFRSQIERGGPVTVTHPEMTRYFMTIPEAVQLVITAGDLGEGAGEVFVLEMGDPVRILDLARNMIALAGYKPETEIAIEFVGPRPGEKLHEELFNDDERREPTSSSRITRAVRTERLEPGAIEAIADELEALVETGDGAAVRDRILELVSETPAGRVAAGPDGGQTPVE